MATYDLKKLLEENNYPGRGIIIGKSADGRKALIAYFIMGRSENSRNRVFRRFEGGMCTKAFDESKVTDPSLIIYNPFLFKPGVDVISNGDQTDTIMNFLNEGKTFEEALATREFEPDAPNYTPRISGAVFYGDKDFIYKLSILKSKNGDPSECERLFYDYTPKAGVGHFIHTYKCDGNPIPSFEGEPVEVELPATGKEFRELLWPSLNEDNKVSLFIRAYDLKDGSVIEYMYNKNENM